jgi:transposase
MEIHELVRLLRTGSSDRDAARLLQLNRRTVARYRHWAAEEGLLTGPLPSMRQLEERLALTLPPVRPPQQVSTVAPYREAIIAYRARGMEVAAIRARLEEVHGHPVSYSAVLRLVRRLAPPAPATFVRVEVTPGSEAQVDFGYAGRTLDPRTGLLRKTWAFVMVLSWSRHLYAELVFDQRVETWLLCHRHAFAAFAGVPERVVLDNLKAAILRASVHDPMVQRAYRECATHYSFRIDPNPPRSPHLKGKVEQGGVHFVKRNFLAGRDPEPIDDLNRKLWQWTLTIAGARVHGTTKEVPLARFREVEQAALRPLPRVPYDLAVWKQARLHRDCHVVFEGSYYSAPYRLVGQMLWIRGGTRTVEIFTGDHLQVATHDRATRPGERKTNLAHLPPYKVPGLVANRDTCRAQAAGIGLATATVVERLLAHTPEDWLRSAQRVVRLSTTVSAERLERACARALHFDTPDYVTIKRILRDGLEAAPIGDALRADAPAVEQAPPRFMFARDPRELVAGLIAGTPTEKGHTP